MRFYNNCNYKYVIFYLIFQMAVLSGCFNSDTSSNDFVIFSSYRDIPGISDNEIEAIEKFRSKGESFVYGMLVSTETFPGANGEIHGYTALLCEWLTKLFGIPFIPEFYQWFDLLDHLQTGKVDFTGELTANEERRKTYFMTDTIAHRSIKYFRLAGSPPLSEIAKTRLPRYILQDKTTIAADVINYAGGTFEPVFVHDYEEVYGLLLKGEADALITESVQEAYFNMYGNIVISDFFPMIYSPVSLSTQNPELEPFISVVQKALEGGGIRYLNDLYDRGYKEFLKQKLLFNLSSEELEFIRENPVIPLGAEYDNYPVSFYSIRYSQWQGLGFDVLNEIESLTGLVFHIVNEPNAVFPELLNMLEAGEISILTEVIPTLERQERFLWPAIPLMADRSVLISRNGHRNININRVYSEKIGLSQGTAHTEFFLNWFPNHPNIVLFESQDAAFDALMKGELDMVMNGYSTLLYLTNYLENSGFKANIIFDNSFISTFGINKDQVVLCSIINKALELIDTGTISEQWKHRTYDYRLRIEQARTPWFIGSIVLSLCVLILVGILFARSYRAGIKLEEIVQKRTYEAALQSATLTTLFDSIPDLIFTKNLNLNFLHCNKAFLEHFNKSINDIVGHSDGQEMGMTDEETENYADMDHKVIKERQTIKIEEVIPRYDGERPLYETIKMPLILNEKVVGVMGISRDITKRKEIEAAALAASLSKSSFLANMSHEIRTPMNAILGVTEILIQYESLPKEIEEGIGKIYSSCDLLLGIINDILDFSKIEAGKLDIMLSPYKVASMINDSVNLNMMRIDSKPIEFELQVDENTPALLFGDELRIKQILNNLLSNAFKYTDTGKVILSVGYETAHENKVTLILSVKDTGLGMTKEQLDRIFDEYSRFNLERKVTIEGTGLGLAITQRLVSLMHGEIQVESEPGAGTFFTVRLPQEIVDSEVIGKDVADKLRRFRMSYLTQNKKIRIARDPMPYGSVLIVDDVETNLFVADGLMKLYRLQIDTAMSGQEAIDKIKSGKTYDIIFMDHMMPEMDGIEAAKHIRELGYKEPIVALTANAVSGQAEMFLQNGFDDFISKPIDIRQLNSILNKFVRDKQPQEVIEAARAQAADSPVPDDNSPKVDPLVIEAFMRDADKTLDWLEENKSTGYEEENILRKFTVLVHGMKSTLFVIGETDLSAFAAKLEKAGHEKDTSIIKEESQNFISQLRALLENLKRKHDEGGEDADMSPSDTADLLVKLKSIQEACADYDRKTALDIISEINKCSKKTKDVLKKTAEHVTHSDFDEAESELSVHIASLEDNNNSSSSIFSGKQIKGLDIEKGLERYENDEKIYLRILRTYAASVRLKLGEMEKISKPALSAENAGSYRIMVHGIKGVSLGIFATNTGTTAGTLEDAAAAGNLKFINEHNEAFINDTWELVSAIEVMLVRITPENMKPVKDKPDHQLLLKLRAACEKYDIDKADNTMEEIEQNHYNSDSELIKWLRETLDKLDFPSIAKKLSNLG